MSFRASSKTSTVTVREVNRYRNSVLLQQTLFKFVQSCLILHTLECKFLEACEGLKFVDHRLYLRKVSTDNQLKGL